MQTLTQVFRFNSVRRFNEWHDKNVSPILLSETLPRITCIKIFDRLQGNKIKVEITKEVEGGPK